MAFDLDKLKTQFKNRVDALLTQNVYTKQAPENAAYPFAVIKYHSGSNIVMWRDDYFADIELWTNETDTTTLNAMATALRSGLHGYYSSDDGLAYRCYLENPFIDIATGKPDLSRVVGTFNIKVF